MTFNKKTVLKNYTIQLFRGGFQNDFQKFSLKKINIQLWDLILREHKKYPTILMVGYYKAEAYYYCVPRIRGSNASRRPSPMKVKARTTIPTQMAGARRI